MKYNEKKAIIISCHGQWDKYSLTDEEKAVLGERYLADGTVRMTYDGVAQKLGLPKGRAFLITERAMIKLSAMIGKKEDLPVNRQEFPRHNQRTWKPSFRIISDLEFETLDIVLAAALMTLGYEFIAIREPQNNGVKKRIVLKISADEVPKLLEKFMRQELLVDASSFHGRLKALKDMLYHKYNT